MGPPIGTRIWFLFHFLRKIYAFQDYFLVLLVQMELEKNVLDLSKIDALEGKQ